MDGCMRDLSAQDSGMFEIPLPETEERPFKIFPDPVEVEVVLTLEGPQAQVEQGKERLPSIVVEPVDVSDVESGELRWPPQPADTEEGERGTPPAAIADWVEGKQGQEEDKDSEEQGEEEESSVFVNNEQNGPLLDLLPQHLTPPTISVLQTSFLNI
ncbi:uncharacterized protein lbhl [Electrophorus electricus]|uniref:uncharacterized protein lbhl n=1 Tax=Electrophorus electricus TaxID=8005 RepID=UPI0015CFCDA3|nr:uncharacterized protein lbhl [Electrophorus electricus]XP_035380791.1 uncharacterized protein lbhl [Electrophorus electricus]